MSSESAVAVIAIRPAMMLASGATPGYAPRSAFVPPSAVPAASPATWVPCASTSITPSPGTMSPPAKSASAMTFEGQPSAPQCSQSWSSRSKCEASTPVSRTARRTPRPRIPASHNTGAPMSETPRRLRFGCSRQVLESAAPPHVPSGIAAGASRSTGSVPTIASPEYTYTRGTVGWFALRYQISRCHPPGVSSSGSEYWKAICVSRVGRAITIRPPGSTSRASRKSMTLMSRCGGEGGATVRSTVMLRDPAGTRTSWMFGASPRVIWPEMPPSCPRLPEFTG
jgi:hypothetical protein